LITASTGQTGMLAKSIKPLLQLTRSSLPPPTNTLQNRHRDLLRLRPPPTPLHPLPRLLTFHPPPPPPNNQTRLSPRRHRRTPLVHIRFHLLRPAHRPKHPHLGRQRLPRLPRQHWPHLPRRRRPRSCLRLPVAALWRRVC